MGLINMECEIECAVDDSTAQIASPSSSNGGDIFGDPQVSPRVGYQYQAEIPPFISENERSQLVKRQDAPHVASKASHPLSLGLPIPIMWSNDEVENTNGTIEFHNSEESHRVDPLDVDSIISHELKTTLDQTDIRCCPLPGSLGESLTNIERDSFVLGLYIFGKNLMLVKRFVGSKEMGDILSFYYGKFYRSAEYLRWSERRKMRSRRCIHGEKLFTGWRQQELLSRLASWVSEDTKNMLLEVSRKFGDGKVSFEEYVFTLKGIIGNSKLIEAVGIGRGKKDLTGMTMDPIKSSPTFPSRPEIPTGKAWSFLTSSDIIKFLTGDFRLSKARSNDLFWEAVWPRLLARGWHSEQPMDHGVSSLKHSLVFLIPGVKKFSRRKLVKGNHYFDSVSDVLNRVASDPELLELETEAEKDDEHKEDHKCIYLQPRKVNLNQNVVKLTIIDTSLVNGMGRSKVRELRSLPVEIADVSSSSSLSSGEDESEGEEEEETKASKLVEDVTDSDCATSIPNGFYPTIVGLETCNSQSQSTSLVNGKQPVKIVKHQVHQNLTACSRGESGRRSLTEGDSHCWSNSPGACENQSSPEKPQTRTLIDLNIPQVSPHSGTDEPFITNVMHNNDEKLEQEAAMNSRRQSSRNRPLTTKALEALQWGFFNTKKKRKGSEALDHNPNSRPSRRLRGRTATSDDVTSNDMSDSNGVLGCNSNMDVNSQESC